MVGIWINSETKAQDRSATKGDSSWLFEISVPHYTTLATYVTHPTQSLPTTLGIFGLLYQQRSCKWKCGPDSFNYFQTPTAVNYLCLQTVYTVQSQALPLVPSTKPDYSQEMLTAGYRGNTKKSGTYLQVDGASKFDLVMQKSKVFTESILQLEGTYSDPLIQWPECPTIIPVNRWKNELWAVVHLQSSGGKSNKTILVSQGWMHGSEYTQGTGWVMQSHFYILICNSTL